MGEMKISLIEQLQYDERESPVYMPNEIFVDLHRDDLRGSNHIGFTYTYYYFISWLYRYAKYGQVIGINVADIKKILGYNSKYTEIDAIIKKGGILDQMDYTYSSTDYPMMWIYDGYDLTFDMFKESDKDTKKRHYAKHGRNYKIKVPAKGLHRDQESEDCGIVDGTFYDVSNTHLVPFDIFIRCMENSKKLGCTAFYLYGFLKNKCQWYNGKYNSSVERVGENTGMGTNTADKYLLHLKESGLIDWTENECRYFDDGFKREPHTYEICGMNDE
jgi:hypothetical protein